MRLTVPMPTMTLTKMASLNRPTLLLFAIALGRRCHDDRAVRAFSISLMRWCFEPGAQVLKLRCFVLVPKLCLGTDCPPSSAWRLSPLAGFTNWGRSPHAKQSFAGTAFPSRAWERERDEKIAQLQKAQATDE